jgi:hypothetical protein
MQCVLSIYLSHFLIHPRYFVFQIHQREWILVAMFPYWSLVLVTKAQTKFCLSAFSIYVIICFMRRFISQSSLFLPVSTASVGWCADWYAAFFIQGVTKVYTSQSPGSSRWSGSK